jgi:uracil-DNA glycosylase
MLNQMEVRIEESWKKRLKKEFEKPYFVQLTEFVRAEYQTQRIYPPAKMLFNAFDACPFDAIKVVIIGQDPYHGAGQANGLCFSVNDGVALPPSLLNIFKEIEADIAVPIPKSGNLQRWATQGVMLLNATLTVREAQPGSHQNKGWEQFTDSVIALINAEKENVVFMLWGAYAQKKETMIDTDKHLVLKSAHPSPLSAHRGFLGCKHFSKANKYLADKGLAPIIW